MPDRAQVVHSTVEAWKQASDELGIRAVAPFTISHGQITVACVAFLPDFGGTHGMVIGSTEPPDFKTDPALIEGAKALGMFYAFLNPEAYSHFDTQVFQRALVDWGYFGSPESRPVWFR